MRAIDDEGLEGPWSSRAPFFASVDNESPSAVVFVRPEDLASLESTSPEFAATEAVDPEGTDVTYEFELDTAEDFASADLLTYTGAHPETGEVLWDLEGAGIVLIEDVWWSARVRGMDGDGIGTPWDTIRVFVRGVNGGAPAPLLIAPADGTSTANDQPTFVFGHVLDPEVDAITYEVVVARDVALTEVVWTVTGLVQGAGAQGSADQTSAQATDALDGALFWSARAVDEGGEGAWAEPWGLTIEEPGGGDDGRGCAACEASISANADATSFGWLAALGLLAVRRRRG